MNGEKTQIPEKNSMHQIYGNLAIGVIPVVLVSLGVAGLDEIVGRASLILIFQKAFGLFPSVYFTPPLSQFLPSLIPYCQLLSSQLLPLQLAYHPAKLYRLIHLIWL